jgi:Restriction endonuclease BglII
MFGKTLFSPKALNKAFEREFRKLGWPEKRYSYCITLDRQQMEAIVRLPLKDQKQWLAEHGAAADMVSFKQTDFVKEKVAVEVQFGKYAFVAFDLFVKHLLFYSGEVIDVGVEILPMKAMARDTAGGRRMSTGIAYYEGEVYNVMRHGRASPPVPLLIIGICD